MKKKQWSCHLQTIFKTELGFAHITPAKNIFFRAKCEEHDLLGSFFIAFSSSMLLIQYDIFGSTDLLLYLGVLP